MLLTMYEKTIEEVYSLLNTQFEGLTSEEAILRLEKYGPNSVSSERKINPLKIFLSQFKNLLVIILLLAGVITGVIGIIENNMESIIDVSVIAIVVLLNAFLGFFQFF